MKSDPFYHGPQPLQTVRPPVYNFVCHALNAMKKLIARFWLISIIIVVLTMEFVWVSVTIPENGTDKSSWTLPSLFFALFIIGAISQFYSRTE